MYSEDEIDVSSVLVVDDDPTSLELLTKVVNDNGFHAHAYSNSKEAWEFLCRAPQSSDIAVLDKMIPEIDGIELLRRIKGKKICQDMPVIMQTGDASATQMRECIDNGAFYYLLKPFHPDVLTSLIQAAVRDVKSRRMLRRAAFPSIALQLVQRGIYVLRTPAEARALAAEIGAVSSNSNQIADALYELMLNAIEHGNLGIGFERKRELILANEWDSEIAGRLGKPEYRDRRVHITLQREKSGLHIAIRDEGSGFDSTPYCTGKSIKTQFCGPNGRGIAKARLGLGFRLQYLGNGNEAHCHVKDPH